MTKWPVYLINMADNPVRLKKCSEALRSQKISFQRFEAVNGRALNSSEIANVYDELGNARRFRHPLVPSEIGVYLSNIAIWRLIAAGKAPGAILLEDDFEICGDLNGVIDALSEDGGHWDIAKLFARRPCKKMLSERRLGDNHRLAQPFQVPNTMLGYAIRREAAAKLLVDVTPFARPVDEDHRHFWEHGLEIAVVLPPPIKQGVEHGLGDTIESARKLKAGRNAFHQGWLNLKYRITYLTRLYYHRISK